MGETALRLAVAAGLGVDAYVHADLAGTYGGIEGELFLVETGVAVAAALLLLTLDRWWTRAVATVVSASAFAAVLVFRYVDVGALGPLPDPYEPVWYPEKAITAVAEAVALVAGLSLLLLRQRQVRRAH